MWDNQPRLLRLHVNPSSSSGTHSSHTGQGHRSRTHSQTRSHSHSHHGLHHGGGSVSANARDIGHTSEEDELEDLLLCLVCHSRVQSPVLCPSCGKMACRSCMETWLQRRQQCPHCRAALSRDRLVPMRMVEELSQALQHVRAHSANSHTAATSHASSHAGAHNDLDICARHNLPLRYYCEPCETSLCADCAMFSGSNEEHKHTVQRLGDVYASRSLSLRTECERARERLRQLAHADERIEERVSRVNAAAADRLSELRQVLADCERRINDAKAQALDELETSRGLLNKEGEITRSVLQEVNVHLDADRVPPSLLVARAAELRWALRQISARPVSTVPSKEALGDDDSPLRSCPLVPAFAQRCVKVADFAQLVATDAVVYSQPLQLFHRNWRLKVYTAGNGAARGEFLSVFLELVPDESADTQEVDVEQSESAEQQSDAPIEYVVELCHASDARRNVARTFASAFANGECWGYNRFLPLREVLDNGFLEDGVLTLRFSLRAPSYEAQSKHWQQRADVLLQEVKRLRQLQKPTASADDSSAQEDSDDDRGSHNESLVVLEGDTDDRHAHLQSEPV